ncbi:hypothetical protein HanPI659440_Chr03g0122821 [Helianthus annuus]|nr:hypothetical protein HanPI659440_Chr03g0122821 [Helianthus annuus]
MKMLMLNGSTTAMQRLETRETVLQQNLTALVGCLLKELCKVLRPMLTAEAVLDIRNGKECSYH